MAAVVLWLVVVFLFWDSDVLYPVKLAVLLLHEISHAGAALFTGGEVRELVVTPDRGGYCDCPGGNAFLTLSSGYLGSVGWGLALGWTGTAGDARARTLLTALALGLPLATSLHAPGGLTLLLGGATGAFLLLAAWRLPSAGRRAVLLALGLTSCLYAGVDVASDVLGHPDATSDAVLLAEATAVPAPVWGVVWILVAAAGGGLLVRRGWHRL